jgi:metal-responsive CopG/Arc/MetJ family transcriptional regulator
MSMTDLVTRERYGAVIDKKLLAEFRKLSDKTRIPASRLLDEAIEDLLKKYEKKSTGE